MRPKKNAAKAVTPTPAAPRLEPAATSAMKPATPKPDAKALKQRLQAVSGVKRAPAVADEAAVIVADNGRKGRRSIAVYMQPMAKAQLDRIAHEHKKSIQALGIEAINLLFRHYDHKPIA